MNYPEYDENKVKVLKVDTFIDMMVQLKKRPGMFLGSNENNFLALSCFISGYTTAKWDEDYTSFLRWLEINVTTNSNPLQTIHKTFGDKAYEKFWEFYESFLEERKKENRTKRST